MNTIALLLSCSPDHPIEKFEWGVAELSNITYRGVPYIRVEVDFVEGEVRFYSLDPTGAVAIRPAFARKITASLQIRDPQRTYHVDPDDPDDQFEPYTPSEVFNVSNRDEEF